MSDIEIRLQCLRIAEGRLDQAAALYAWVMGRSDKTPKDQILSALEAAGVS